MARHTPAELLEISKAETRRKRHSLDEQKRADVSAQQAATKAAAVARQIKLERDTLWHQILSAAMSSTHELEIENPTKAQLDFLAEKGIDHGARYIRINTVPRLRDRLDSLTTKAKQVEDQISQMQDDREDALIASNDDVNDWVERNYEVAFQASLEPWFGEDLDEYWSFDRDVAVELREYLAGQIESSWQKKKVGALRNLKKLIDAQLSLDGKYLRKIKKPEDELLLLQLSIKNVERDIDLHTDEARNSLYWVSLKRSVRQEYLGGDSDIALLNWITERRGQSSLKQIDSALFKKASSGERKAVFTIGEKPPYQTVADTSDEMNHRYNCDGQLVSPSGPDAHTFCLLMEALGYSTKLKLVHNDVWQVTVSW